MEKWIGFYALIGGAAATLMGLLFVAVSLNADVILGEKHQNSRRLAQQAFQNYLAVMLVSLLSLFPSLDTHELGVITLSATAVSGVWVVVRVYMALTRPSDRASRLYWIRRQIPSVLGFGMLLFAATKMALDTGDSSRNLYASATIVLLVGATTVSWELLIGLAVIKTASAAAAKAAATPLLPNS
jgi:hypothetical protein